MSNSEIITSFYDAFARGDYKKMSSYYHDDLIFEDPAFGKLNKEKASLMWQMLLSRKGSSPKINYSDVVANDSSGQVKWVAKYLYGPKKRLVINHIKASFKFENGLIIKHTDEFNLHRWSGQALGPVGYMLGWTSFMKNKIQKMANHRLEDYIKKQSSKS